MQTVLQMGPMANPEYHEAKAVKSNQYWGNSFFFVGNG
jgi:hypothetical protein